MNAFGFGDGGTIFFAGGGSGGHLFPGLAVADEFVARVCRENIGEPNVGWDVVFVGSDRRIEQTILRGRSYETVVLPAVPSTLLQRHPLKFCWRFWKARRDAKRLLQRRRARAVIGLGGYASVPMILAAASLGLPTILLEQNMVAGRANRWLSRWAELVCHAFDAAVSTTPRAVNCSVTGNPLRRSITEIDWQRLADAKLSETSSPNSKQKKTLLVLGGSQGATALNAAVFAAVRELETEIGSWRVVHQTGPHDLVEAETFYRSLNIEHVVSPFFSDLVEWYRSADCLISRAGATTLAEISCAGIPAILIPSPYSLRDHQVKNALFYEQSGAAIVVRQHVESQITANMLSSALKELMGNAELRANCSRGMFQVAKPDAAADVVELLMGTIGERFEPQRHEDTKEKKLK